MRPVLAIVGASSPGPRALAVAEDLGREAVEAGFRIACGGLGGVMEAASRGAMEAGGLTIGVLPGQIHRSFPISSPGPWAISSLLQLPR